MKTLSQVRASPVLAPLDLRAVKVPAVMANYQAARKYLDQRGGIMAQPEHDALSFYLANAAYAQIVQRVAEDEPLGDYLPLLLAYQDTIRTTSMRLFFYLLLICTRESRHIHSNSSFFASLEAKYGCMGFTKSLRGLGSTEAANRLITSPPDYTLGAYTDHLLAVFSDGADHKLFNGGYGGKAWASIAKVLRNFVHGVTSAELMLDTGYALAHNNGPIFNKDMLYKHYDQYELIRILDVQRAGMVPQYVGSKVSSYIQPAHVALHNQMRAALGDVVVGDVDWNKVEALGSVQKYTKEKKQAKAKVSPASPDSVFITPLIKIAPKKVARKKSA